MYNDKAAIYGHAVYDNVTYHNKYETLITFTKLYEHYIFSKYKLNFLKFWSFFVWNFDLSFGGPVNKWSRIVVGDNWAIVL